MILKMLAIDEADRITFEELFKSQLFNNINEVPNRMSNIGIVHQMFFNQLHQDIDQNQYNMIEIIN